MPEPVKVLHIIDTLWLGGAQTVLKDYFQNQQSNTDIFLYALRTSEPQITINHSNVHVINSTKRYSLAPIKILKQFIKENNITVLHCHLFRSHVFGYILKRFYFKDIKLIIHEHSDIIDNSIAASTIKFIKKKVDLFITCSNALKKELISRTGIKEDKVVTIYNGIDLSKYQRNVKTSNLVFTVGFLGRLTERKGWKKFIEVTNSLKNDTSIRFLIAGDGADRQRLLNRIAELGLKNITYLGYVPDSISLYAQLDCLIIPSNYEPMGIVALEAQAMKTPVIASNVDGLNEVVSDKENALLFEKKNVRGIIDLLGKLRSDSTLRERLISNGIHNAKKFSIENFINSLNKAYSAWS